MTVLPKNIVHPAGDREGEHVVAKTCRPVRYRQACIKAGHHATKKDQSNRVNDEELRKK